MIDDDYRHGTEEAAGTIRLEAGLHPLRLYYETEEAKPLLLLQWSGPEMNGLQTVPATALFHKR